MKSSEVKKDSVGHLIVEKYPYCTVYSKMVDADCWVNCHMYCRHRQVNIDEACKCLGRGYSVGYANGKWKNMPNYHCLVDIKIVGIPEYMRHDPKTLNKKAKKNDRRLIT